VLGKRKAAGDIEPKSSNKRDRLVQAKAPAAQEEQADSSGRRYKMRVRKDIVKSSDVAGKGKKSAPAKQQPAQRGTRRKTLPVAQEQDGANLRRSSRIAKKKADAEPAPAQPEDAAPPEVQDEGDASAQPVSATAPQASNSQQPAAALIDAATQTGPVAARSRKRNAPDDNDSVVRHKRARFPGTDNIEDLATLIPEQPTAIHNPIRVGDLIAKGKEIFKQDPEERFLIDN
jgi:hypothetical protein